MKDTNNQDVDSEDMSYSDESDNTYDSESDNDNDDLEIDPITFFTIKEKCYYRTINKFFKSCSSSDISKMINIVEGKSTISLRVLDWFVTKYSRKRIDCNEGKKDVDNMFDVRISYKAQLKSYKKQYFDPFRRKKKFNYNFENGMSMKTTIGQLNFFKWAFNYGIVPYVEKNLKQISKEIKTSNKPVESKKKEDKKDNKKKKSSSSSTRKNSKKIKNKNGDNNSGTIKINSTKSQGGETHLTLVFD